MKNALKGTVHRLGTFAEKKREQAIINITNSTATGLLLKWAITNKVSILICIILVASLAYYKHQADTFRELADKQRIEELNKELEEEKANTAALKKTIDDFKKGKIENTKLNQEFREKLKSQTNEQLKQILIIKKNKLITIRGGIR